MRWLWFLILGGSVVDWNLSDNSPTPPAAAAANSYTPFLNSSLHGSDVTGKQHSIRHQNHGAYVQQSITLSTHQAASPQPPEGSPRVALDGLEVVLPDQLECYACTATDAANDECYNLSSSAAFLADDVIGEQNSGAKIKSVSTAKCGIHQKFCQVHRVEYLHSGNASEEDKAFKPWSLERGCAEDCTEFCVTMGARTKIRYCTSCCTHDHCNVDNAAAPLPTTVVTAVMTSYLLLLASLID